MTTYTTFRNPPRPKMLSSAQSWPDKVVDYVKAVLAQHGFLYSKAQAATAKLKIDCELLAKQGSLNWDISKAFLGQTSNAYLAALIAKMKRFLNRNNDVYLKALIEKAAGKGLKEFLKSGNDIQLFIVRGGGEGFLDDLMLSGITPQKFCAIDADAVSSPNSTLCPDLWDLNDLVAAFTSAGQFIGSALLLRPSQVPPCCGHSELTLKTANKVYEAWDDCDVDAYLNQTYGYVGICVNDSLQMYSKDYCRIDLHEKMGTFGCILIFDLGVWTEIKSPGQTQFLVAVLGAMGYTYDSFKTQHGSGERVHLGRMHMIQIQ